MTFADLNLSPQILNNLSAMGIETPTDIQLQAIPILLAGDHDFVGMAQTGTGKTAAFVLPLLERLDLKRSDVQCLILTPTRELAKQIAQEMLRMGAGLPIRHQLVYGGASYADQISGLRKGRPHVVIGTPGRIIDLMERGVLKFDQSQLLILDEADEMLNMGFKEAVDTIMEQFNPERRIWMFSATMPKAIANMIDRNFSDPVTVKAQAAHTRNELVEQHYCIVDARKKADALARFIVHEDIQSAMVFCKMRIQTTEVVEKLHARGIKAECLNGDMGQSQREAVMGRFKQGKLNVLVCTDVAARGIDVSGLSHVFNYSLPNDFDSYTHRIGRTGRAGKSGKAYNLVTPAEMGQLRRIEHVLRHKMNKIAVPTPAQIKQGLIKQHLNNLMPIIERARELKENFGVDESFTLWQDAFAHNTKEELLKIMFASSFNRDFRQIDDIGDLNLKQAVAKTAFGRDQFNDRPYRSHRKDRQDRGNHHRGDRSKSFFGGRNDNRKNKNFKRQDSPRQ